ncbi:hypothetical protein GCM10027046_39250 [Uliginosibacterium flavum]|uniref:Uncharacterized protein n=1 Tax=Uliginosibacterium flavum TaxID=1396831 RepID=A0ABV2TKM2_9RHOO
MKDTAAPRVLGDVERHFVGVSHYLIFQKCSKFDGRNRIDTVGDLSLSIDSGGSGYFGDIMLQGHNNASGVSYDIYWDNLAAVPAGRASAAC